MGRRRLSGVRHIPPCRSWQALCKKCICLVQKPISVERILKGTIDGLFLVVPEKIFAGPSQRERRFAPSPIRSATATLQSFSPLCDGSSAGPLSSLLGDPLCPFGFLTSLNDSRYQSAAAIPRNQSLSSWARRLSFRGASQPPPLALSPLVPRLRHGDSRTDARRHFPIVLQAAPPMARHCHCPLPSRTALITPYLPAQQFCHPSCPVPQRSSGRVGVQSRTRLPLETQQHIPSSFKKKIECGKWPQLYRTDLTTRKFPNGD